MAGINIGNGNIWAGEGHILTCAPTRSGKGYYIINATLTDDKLRDHDAPSFVVLDPKGENIRISGEYLKSAGYEVHCLNPYNIRGLEEFGLSAFNPLLSLDPFSEDIDEIIDTIAYSLIPLSSHKNKFFDDSARDLIINYIRHLITQTEDEISFKQLYFYCLAEGKELDDLTTKMALNRHFEGVISKYGKAINGKRGTDTWGSIVQTAQTALSMFGRRKLARTLSGFGFEMKDLDEKKIAVFLCMPSNVIEKNAPWLRIFFGSMLYNLMQNYYPKRRVVLLMDEFVKLGYLKEVEDFFTIGAHYATIWPIIQDLKSLSKVYDTWETIVGSCRIKHWFSNDDNMTRDYLVKRMPMRLDVVGRNTDGSVQKMEKPLLRPDEIGTYPKILLEIRGKGFFELEKIPYLQQNKNGKDLRAQEANV